MGWKFREGRAEHRVWYGEDKGSGEEEAQVNEMTRAQENASASSGKETHQRSIGKGSKGQG